MTDKAACTADIIYNHAYFCNLREKLQIGPKTEQKASQPSFSPMQNTSISIYEAQTRYSIVSKIPPFGYHIIESPINPPKSKAINNTVNAELPTKKISDTHPSPTSILLTIPTPAVGIKHQQGLCSFVIFSVRLWTQRG